MAQQVKTCTPKPHNHNLSPHGGRTVYVKLSSVAHVTLCFELCAQAHNTHVCKHTHKEINNYYKNKEKTRKLLEFENIS